MSMESEHVPTGTVAGIAGFDRAKHEAFLEKAFGDLSGAYAVALCALGDRLGLFKALAGAGPLTSAEVAERTSVRERYAREWLSGMASGGYLEHDPASGRFALPREHAAVLAEEYGPSFLGGEYQQVPALLGVLDLVTRVFREGGGVPQSAYPQDFWDGLERSTGCSFDNFLVQRWIPAMPDVQAKLEQGAQVADVGCGRGRALIRLAQAYPSSRFVGYDVFAPTIAAARANAETAGVADRVRFEQADVAAGLPERYDIITTFDVIHDSADPAGMLRAIRAALRPGGIYVLLEFNAGETLGANTGPLGPYLYASSVLYCMTTSLAQGGAGLGTAGMSESTVRRLCGEAGFAGVRRLPLDDPFHAIYEVRP